MGSVTHLIGADMAAKLTEDQLTMLEMAIELEITKNPVIQEQLAPVFKEIGSSMQIGPIDIRRSK